MLELLLQFSAVAQFLARAVAASTCSCSLASDVIGLVGNHVDEGAARTLLGPGHQLFEFLLARRPVFLLPRELLAAVKVVEARIGKKREPAVACGGAR